MQHVEFFDSEHFEKDYFRVPPPDSLSPYIDFIWETRFDELLQQYPKGFSDVLFPNIGYTYLINLGTPFVMQIDNERFEMKTDGFLPRPNSIECHHQQGNRLFGIKFKISPVLFEKKVNFSEYKGFIFPLSYLAEQKMIDDIKKAPDFSKRVELVYKHYEQMITNRKSSLKEISIVTDIINSVSSTENISVSIEELAQQHKISTRTLQRYFEKCIGISTKQALQILRIRKAANHLVASPKTFDYLKYGYYDHSHFHKHLKQFLQKETLQRIKPHLQLLSRKQKT